MSSKILVRQVFLRFSLVVLACGSMAACDDNGDFAVPGFGGDGATDAAVATSDVSPAVSLVERDVESPEVFSVTENGLWDGRPSLGGVWVAHPDVVDPERVIIRNQTNNNFVIGALFRRERDNPGPALQISSDAAEELGVLAGSPTLLSVIALRREEGPAASEVAEAFAAPEPIAATSLDVEPGEVVEMPVVELVAATPVPSSTDTLAGAAAIAIAAAEAASGDRPAAVESTAMAAQPAPPAPAPAPRASSLDKPFIQIGIFSVEDNASRTSE